VPKNARSAPTSDRDTIVVYQAYSHAIADAALEAKRFRRAVLVPPNDVDQAVVFVADASEQLGAEERQERTLAVRIKRSGWEKALSLAVLTSFEPCRFCGRARNGKKRSAMRRCICNGPRTIAFAAGRCPLSSVQVGLSRHVIEEYVADWVVEIPVGLGRKTTSTYGVPGSFTSTRHTYHPDLLPTLEPCRFCAVGNVSRQNSPAKLSLRA